MTSNDILISLSWTNAEIAKKWITMIMDDLNNLMKERAKIKGENSIAYLTNKLNQTKDSDVRQSFIGMIKQETQKMMLADIREQYLFETIDNPIIPAYTSKPQKKLITILGLLGGFIIGIFAALYRETSKNTSNIEALK